jgi:hypothetical protein
MLGVMRYAIIKHVFVYLPPRDHGVSNVHAIILSKSVYR